MILSIKIASHYALTIFQNSRETEWMFCTDEGRKQLSVSAGFERLVVVTLHREHLYENLDANKAELSGKVMELAPPRLGNRQASKLIIMQLPQR